MLLLAIDTSSDSVSVALMTDIKQVFHKEQKMERGQGEALIPLIQELFKESGYSIQDLTDVAVAVGPGSFTGVRIGIATARAFALALDIPVHGVTDFEAYSYGITKPITVVLNSKRGDYFIQKFNANGAVSGTPRIATVEQLKKELPFVAVGDSSKALSEEIGCQFLDKTEPIAVCVGKIAMMRLNTPVSATPLYLREADVTV